jgi:2'-5' RNA ligase
VRLFVAVFPPDEVSRDLRRRLVGERGRGSPDARLTSIDGWHVTLAFLGEVGAERLADVERALAAVTVPRGIELRIRGGGQFGKGRSTVLWAHVDGDLTAVHADILRRLDSAGLPYDDRDFIPHLTVAYVRDPAVRRALDGYQGPPWTLDEIALVRSAPNEGYTLLKTW